MDSPYVRTYPSKGVVLHYHFAKFQLNSLALRAISPAAVQFSTDRKEAANIAIASALATLNLVLEDRDVRDAIVGVPIFTLTMVTFSAVFLLKVAVIWTTECLNIDPRQVQHLVERVIELMTSVSAGERHLTRHIASGLGKMLERFKAWDGSSATAMAAAADATTTSAGTWAGNDDKYQNNNNAAAGGGVLGGGEAGDGDLNANNLMISDMVGAYGFGLDEHLLDPYMMNYSLFST